MPRIFIDFAGDDTPWGGDIAVQMLDRDSLRGTDAAIAIGDHELILTIPQAVTLYELLDGWVNGGPITEIGAVERRLGEALKDATEEFTPAVRGAMRLSMDRIVRALHEAVKRHGLRFRMAGEGPDEDHSLSRRYERFRQLRDRAVERDKGG